MEICYKCDGEGGEQLADGWMPCYCCGTTGKLPEGTRASICRECDGYGDVHWTNDEDGSEGWSKCEHCIGGTKLAEVPTPKKMSCGHYTHEEGGPSDYPARCR